MLRSFCGCSDERKVDVSGGCGRQLFLCLLCRFFESLQSHLVIGKVYAFLFLKFSDHVIGQLLVEVIAAQTVVSGCGKNFNNAVADLDDRHIKSTAAKVIYHDLLLFLIVKSISQGCCRRLVDDTFYIQARDLSCVLGSLTLCVIEVCRYGDDSLCHLFSQISFCVCFQLLQDHCGDLLRRILLVIDRYSVIRAHLSFNRRNGSLCICNSLTFCRLAHQTLAGLCKCYDRRCGSCSLCVCDYCRLPAFHNGYAAICGS